MKKVVKAVFEFDGENLNSEGMTLNVRSCFVEGVEVPVHYAILLLNNETRNEAWCFFRKIKNVTLMRGVREHVLETVFEKGFEKGWCLVKKLEAEAPRGKPRFYVKANWDMKPDEHHVDITDGEKCFRFWTEFNAAKIGLPPNLYTEYTYTGFGLTKKMYDEASGCLREFFAFTEKLNNASEFISSTRAEEALQTFFSDRQKAYEMLARIEVDASRRKRRNKLYERLENEGVLKFSEGYIIHTWRSVYFVSEDGYVRKPDYKKSISVKEAVFRAVEKGKLPKKMGEVEDRGKLRDVAEVIGKIKPELVPVILP